MIKHNIKKKTITNSLQINKPLCSWSFYNVHDEHSTPLQKMPQSSLNHHQQFYSASPSVSTPISRSFAQSPTDDNSDEGNVKVDFYFPGAASLSDQLDSKYQTFFYIQNYNRYICNIMLHFQFNIC